ncbi:hypothetical protein CC86DRAFT_163934 [Ophiobolus disseminans]|uniref:Glycosyl transferase family 25 domain-containing protein n=1 Tax=Ophiobolus disseminans TaxID=1469910 RepID=A0A6A7ABI7_9PLEO|nr:hypothetical protein CC86DRAFT_163934 [Ophiobolus disseminans]
MPSRNYGRVCILFALCLIFLLFVIWIDDHHLRNTFRKQYPKVDQGIDNSTLGFEAIFAINAPWRTDRKDSLMLATAHTGATIEWIDGINASSIDERAYPQGNHRTMTKGNLGSWRAHMNVIRTIIEQNLSTALILEDDADWDHQLRHQLASFGLAARTLPDMLKNADRAGQVHIPSTDETGSPSSNIDPMDLTKRSTLPLPSTFSASSYYPYGDKWDILWLGHCGTSFPPHQNGTAKDSVPDRLKLLNDPTVPPPQLTSAQSPYPPNTRIYHRTHSTLCTLAYAVSQGGARKIMYEHGMRNLDKGYDFALSEWCDGETKHMGERPMCLTSSPAVFGHYWPDNREAGGGKSDIAGVGGGGIVSTGRGLVRSVRGGLEALINGEDL